MSLVSSTHSRFRVFFFILLHSSQLLLLHSSHHVRSFLPPPYPPRLFHFSYPKSLVHYSWENTDEVLTLRVQDPFHRLLLHGVCEFYNLASVTVSESEGNGLMKMTKITKREDVVELPKTTLSHFLKMTKEGIW